MNTLLLFAAKALIASGALAAAGHWIAARLHPVNIHTAHARLDAVLNTLINACESVVVAELHGDALDRVVTTLLSGKGIANALSVELPQLRTHVLQQVGPAVQQALAELLGGQDAADARVTTELLVAAHTHAVESAKRIITLADGRKLVAPVGA